MISASRNLRILLVNKFYRHNGGDCVHFLALEELLRENGCEVAVMAMAHPSNKPLPVGSFEVPAVKIDGSMPEKLRAVARILGNNGIRKSVREAIESFQPDIVHLHNIHSYLSPAVAEEAHKAGIPVVWTLHDYKLICGSYSCLRDGTPCVECLCDSIAILRHRCMKGSLVSSVAAFAESKKWNRGKLQGITDKFICPSEFMCEKMLQGGISSNSLAVLHNFSPVKQRELSGGKRDGVCYVGRLSPEKGLEYLLDAAVSGGWNLTVAGDGPLKAELEDRYGSHANISFVGRLNSDQVAELFSRSQLTVLPSVCFENNPLSVVESLSLGTPVAASRIGGLPELIKDDNGMLFEPWSSESINETVLKMLDTRYDNIAISQNAIREFSSNDYFSKLSSIYRSLLDGSQNLADPENK